MEKQRGCSIADTRWAIDVVLKFMDGLCVRRKKKAGTDSVVSEAQTSCGAAF